MLHNFSKRVVFFCAVQCAHQQSGEMSVYHMICAYQWAHSIHRMGIGEGNLVIKLPPSIEDILEIGALVEPLKNAGGFRSVPVHFSSLTNPPIEASLIRPALTNLIEAWPRLQPIERYKEFELIHPFIDGNGRVGALLYNWDNINQPEQPPYLFTKENQDA